MHRDLAGYKNNTPRHPWPNKAKIAVNFVLNYEEGSESNILHGDAQSEDYLTDIPGAIARPNERHLSIESTFEYGARAGAWRLLNLFQELQIPATIFATGQALELNPDLAAALKLSNHDIAGHGYRWINYHAIPKEIEIQHFQKTIKIIHDLTGKPVKGWYTGRKSIHTLDIVRELNLLYSSDSYADDLPYWKEETLMIPYSLDTNDARFSISPGFSTGIDFFNYLKDTFDCLYREGEKSPKMMSVGLHGRLCGRPGRAEGLRHFIEYIKTFDNAWICRRQEIAEHWIKEKL